jgi:hypothetical protein
MCPGKTILTLKRMIVSYAALALGCTPVRVDT